MAINVTGNIANIAVNTTSNVVTVSSSPVNVQLSATSVVSNASVRQAINVSNLSGFGNLTYDSSNTSNGVIQYTGTSTTDVRNSISASSPVTYNQSSGVIGLEQTLDDLTLKKYQETVVAHGNSSGNIAVDVANGTIHTFTLTGNVTKITTPNIATGGSATIILTQDGVGNNILDTTTHPLEWVNWDFVNDFKTLDLTAGNYSILNILWDGTKYYASLVVDSEISPTSLTVSGNIVGGNIDSQGVITSTGDITSSANINAVSYTGDGSQLTGIDSNADVKTFIEANGLDATANLTTTASLKSTGALGLVVTGNATVGGNLDVTGNINSETVVDLFVEDRNITLQFSNVDTSPTSNSQIFIDRGTESNTYIKWDEGSDKWKFSNDGTVEYEMFTYDGSNITAGNANIDTSINIAENSGANGSLNLHANTSTTVYPNVVLYAPGHGRMLSNPTAFAARLSPNGIEVNNLGDANVTSNGATRGFTVDTSQIRMFSGSTTGTSPIQLQVQNETDFSLNPGTVLQRGKLRINKQGAGSIQTVFTDIVTHEDLQLFDVPFGGQVQLNNGALLGTNKTLGGGTAGTNSIDVSGQIRSTDKIYTAASANIHAAGNLVADQNIVTLNNVTGGTLTATGNITGANINANYFHGDGSNLTGIAGDISSVVAGVGLSGGGTSGAVTLNLDPTVTTTAASSGGSLAYDNSTGVFTFAPADTQTDAEVRALLSVGTPATPSGNGSLAYDSGTGVFTLTPAETQTDAEVRALLSTTTASASGGGSLAYDSGTGVFTFAPADSVTTATNATNATNATQVAITDDTSTDAPHYVTLSPAASGNQALEVSSSKLSFNPSSGVLQTDHISSDSGQPLQLKGQTNGIQLDKTISSAESRIFDADTTGYGVASADLGAFSNTTSCPGFLCGLFITAGNNFGTAYDLSGSFGLYAQKEGANNAYTSMFGSSSLQNAIETTAGVNAKTSGWSQFSLTDSSSAAAFPADTYVTSIVGNQVNFSQNALKTYGASSFFVLAPGAASSTHADLRFRFSRDTANASLPFQSIEPWMSKYVGPETFANTTLDYASYTISGTTIDAGNVVTRNSIDINSNPDSAIRTQRALLIGANATPDSLSVGTTDVLPGTTTLGITVEQDGQTDFGGANTTPQMKFMMNNYTDNSIGRFTSYPPWTEFLGQSGNATVDLQYLGAPNFNYKLIGGSKDAKVATKTSDVIGRLTFNNVVPGVVSGADIFHPPASLTVRAPGSGAQANNTVGNADVHLQSTYSTSFRNGANIAGGTIPRTFLSSSEGNTVIAAKTDGKVTLRPVRDYGDEGADTTYVENRFAHELHEYHEFLGAGFLSSKAGTLVEIQPKSGETGGSANFNYDSKGDATLRLSTHEANNTVKKSWDITSEQSSANLIIRDHTNSSDKIEVSGARTEFNSSVRLQNLTTAQMNALSGPASGDMIFNTDENLMCIYNGTAWRKINDAAI